MPTLVALESSVAHDAIESPFAARAPKAVRPADLSQNFYTLGLRSVELEELEQGKPLLVLKVLRPMISGACPYHSS